MPRSMEPDQEKYVDGEDRNPPPGRGGLTPNVTGDKQPQRQPRPYGGGVPLRGANKPSYGWNGRAVSSVRDDQSMSHATGLDREVGGSPGGRTKYMPFGDEGNGGSKLSSTDRKR
jgi:hypothetical protein